MCDQYKHLRDQLEQKAIVFNGQNPIPHGVKKCLLNSGSLIKCLEDMTTVNISSILKNQRWDKPDPNESKILKLLSGSYGFIRETLLVSDEHPLVFARTVIPPKTLPCTPKRICLGEKPLGYFLFSNRHARRGEIAIVALKTNSGEIIWGRRSIFYIRHKPLLITEILLPATILQCIKKSR